MSSETTTIDLFISHSEKDAQLASALINLFVFAVPEINGKIFCSSKPGYGPKIGKPNNQDIKDNLINSKIVLGLITPNSLKSNYVLAELGAAWGLGRSLLLVVSNQANFGNVSAPLSEYTIGSLYYDENILDLIDRVANILKYDHQPAVKYFDKVKYIKELAIAPPLKNIEDVSLGPGLVIVTKERQKKISEYGGELIDLLSHLNTFSATVKNEENYLNFTSHLNTCVLAITKFMSVTVLDIHMEYLKYYRALLKRLRLFIFHDINRMKADSFDLKHFGNVDETAPIVFENLNFIISMVNSERQNERIKYLKTPNQISLNKEHHRGSYEDEQDDIRSGKWPPPIPEIEFEK